jgi:sugar phosphate isomerase/epimerase
MKISLYVHFFDLIPAKESLLDKLNHLVIPDEKHQMYKTKSLDLILRSLKKVGVDGLELLAPSVTADKDIGKIKEIIKKYDLPVLSIHQSNSNIKSISLSEIEKLCILAKNFSAKVVTLHSDTLGDKLFDKSFILNLKEFQTKYELQFGIENMPKSPFSILKPYTYEPAKFSSLINNSGLNITLDTTHLGQVNSSICKFYAENKEKIINIHLSDYKISKLNRVLLLSNDTHLPLTKGELPIAEFLKLLKKDNYNGLITMEINADLDGLCQSAETIKNAFK